MRPVRPTAPTDRFLGVRLSAEEVALLDSWKESEGHATRSDAVRAILRAVGTPGAAGPELPTTVRGEFDQLVEDGYARDVPSAIDAVLTLGLQELARLHAERLPSLRRAARDVAERGATRRRLSREGRRLLER